MADERVRLWGGGGGGLHSASDGRDCTALVSAREPLEMVAAEPQLLPFREIDDYFHDQGTCPMTPEKTICC